MSPIEAQSPDSGGIPSVEGAPTSPPGESPREDAADPRADETANGEPPERGKGNAEAAKYRVRLREAEQQLDEHRQQLTRTQEILHAAQRANIMQVAAEKLSVPDDLFDVGRVEFAELLDDSGAVDPERVRAAAADLVRDRPRLAVQQWPDTGQDRLSRPPRHRASWSDVLRS